MRKLMKRLVILVSLLCLLVCAAAQAEWAELTMTLSPSSFS